MGIYSWNMTHSPLFLNYEVENSRQILSELSWNEELVR